METRPQSPQPPGSPRWVAMFYLSTAMTWRVAAESPYRSPVLHAVGQMMQTVRGRGESVSVDLWGPDEGSWKRFDPPAAAGPVTGSQPPAEKPKETGKLAERVTDRRHQVLRTGLGKAGIYDLTPEDSTAIQAMVEQLDEETVRRVAHWLATAGGDG